MLQLIRDKLTGWVAGIMFAIIALAFTVGFGTFQVKQRAARNGRNPKTGATIFIPASKAPTFKAGKGLKTAVN